MQRFVSIESARMVRRRDSLAADRTCSSGQGVACAVGDYDNDGHADLAVALSDRVILFHNLGHGKFADVTKIGRY